MFLKKISSFFVIFAFVLLGCFLMNKVIVDKLFEKESKLPVKTKWLAIGDSHIVNALNPEDYPWLVNRAHSGERLLYNLEKVKYYVENNPQIELVILGYWHNTMMYDKDWVLYGKDAPYRYESYLPLLLLNDTDVSYLDVSENRKLFWENYWGFKIGYPSPAVKLAVKNFFTFNEALEMRGGFKKAGTKYIKKKSIHKKDTTNFVVDSLALKNLKDVVSYLSDKKIKLVLLNTPVTDEFLSPLKELNVDLMHNTALSYVGHKNIWYLDYTNHEVADELFKDSHHLNTDGANYFTPILVDSIQTLIKNKN